MKNSTSEAAPDSTFSEKKRKKKTLTKQTELEAQEEIAGVAGLDSFYKSKLQRKHRDEIKRKKSKEKENEGIAIHSNG